MQDCIPLNLTGNAFPFEKAIVSFHEIRAQLGPFTSESESSIKSAGHDTKCSLDSSVSAPSFSLVSHPSSRWISSFSKVVKLPLGASGQVNRSRWCDWWTVVESRWCAPCGFSGCSGSSRPPESGRGWPDTPRSRLRTKSFWLPPGFVD